MPQDLPSPSGPATLPTVAERLLFKRGAYFGTFLRPSALRGKSELSALVRPSRCAVDRPFFGGTGKSEREDICETISLSRALSVFPSSKRLV